ncbi:TPA: DUF4435 domain-containing protein [Vibrio parahaemolyticus]|uniref:DUF4435 domain-containing protein n=1 Tax=Vibrio parahaemolyticus TaxID=670 RepID=UPI000B78C5C9|nr:DUF4435 domain-containing protein [Vibrio parahaemolyticus]AWA91571.1 DUF4435 domain-containing protein [Vibrio parahaemolyticus]EGQ9757399.1 DUF4435 domain-containing protein [Vibrio parahaemolyticus]EII5811172.1 DUF4435 domain-containing protein [Vibrio parahaemolyticus]EJX1248150.1 DUF4435 domain-containing protein [Vibrio parahaemolyticus]EJY7730308.1 DUF4435 domain-containing protein [Vibrio parahaemolyticus]
MSDDFCYSPEAEDIVNQFYSVDVMVYVEGKDDMPFWELMFEKFSEHSVEIQEVGGCTALEPYINRINSGELTTAIVACDTDLTNFLSQRLEEHPNIIRTPKYAIENTMITVENIAKAINRVSRLSKRLIKQEDISRWLDDFYSNCLDLVLYDVHNAKFSHGIAVVGDNASRFMKSRSSSLICKEKIKTHVEQLSAKFDDFNRDLVVEEIHSKGYLPNDLIRGHFLFSAVAKFVNEYSRKKGYKNSISNDSLYAVLVLALETTLTEKSPDYEFFKERIERVQVAA